MVGSLPPTSQRLPIRSTEVISELAWNRWITFHNNAADASMPLHSQQLTIVVNSFTIVNCKIFSSSNLKFCRISNSFYKFKFIESQIQGGRWDAPKPARTNYAKNVRQKPFMFKTASHSHRKVTSFPSVQRFKMQKIVCFGGIIIHLKNQTIY